MIKRNYTLDILLRQVGKAHANKVNKVLDEYNMHKGQPMMLKLLSKEDGIPQSALSKEMVITPATVSAMVKRMEKTGFVVRKRDAEDERVCNVYLTDAGRKMSNELNDLQNDMEEIVFDGFSEEEKVIMRDFLERILKNLTE